MTEREPRADRSPPGDEAGVRGLIEAAGPRPPIPDEDLEAIASAARSAWRMQVHRHRREAAPAPVPRPRRAAALALALAATLAAAVGLAWWWSATRSPATPGAIAQIESIRGAVYAHPPHGDPRRLEVGDELPPGSTLVTSNEDFSGRVSLRLEAGASIRLDSNGRLRLVSGSAVELAGGELYAATDGGAGRGAALEVRTPLGTARDLGTQFTVAVVGPTAEVLRVRVREGTVLVERDGEDYRTGTGEELVVARDGRVARRTIATHGEPWSWVLEAAPPFEGGTLGDLLRWVERETAWRIRYEDPDLAADVENIVLYGGVGDFRPDDAPFAVLPGAGLEGELEDGVLTVRRPR